MNRRNLLNTLLVGAVLPAQAIAQSQWPATPPMFVWREVEIVKSVGEKIVERGWERIFSTERERQFEVEHEGYHAQCRATLTRFHREKTISWSTQWFVSKGHEVVNGHISGLGCVDRQIALAKSVAEAALTALVLRTE